MHKRMMNGREIMSDLALLHYSHSALQSTIIIHGLECAIYAIMRVRPFQLRSYNVLF